MRAAALLAMSALLLALCAVAFASCASDVKDETLPATEHDVELTMFQRLAMASAVRHAFAVYPDFDKLTALPKEANIPDLGNLPIFVSIFHKAAPMIWGVGLEGDTQERLLRAAVQVMRHPDFQKTYLVDRERIAVKIDVITSLQPIAVAADGSGDSVEPGVHGLMVREGARFFFQLPTDFLMLGWEREADRVRDRKLKMISELSRQAGWGAKGWRDRPLYRFKTHSFLQEQPDYAPVVLYRGVPASPQFSGQDIQDGALRAGRHMLQNVEESHRFRDRFDPFENEAAGFFHYNPTDHAAALWSLSVLFNYSRRVEIIDQTKPALLWLMQHIDVPLMEPEASHLKFFQNAKTAATAMSLLALTEMPRVVIDELGRARVNRLAYYLTVVQAEDGDFFPTYYHKLLTLMPDRRPREMGALPVLALARYWRVNPNADWLYAAEAAANREIEHYEKTGQFDRWSAEALAELWRATQEDRYADVALRMAEAVVSTQYAPGNRPYRDYEGGFQDHRPPRVEDTAVAVHTLYVGAKLAKERGEDPKPFEDAVLRAAAFILTQQFNKQNTYYLPFPDEVYGAIRKSPVDDRVELEPMVHAVAALCEAFDIHADRVQRKLKALQAQGKAPGWKPLSPEELKQLEELKKAAAEKAKAWKDADPPPTPAATGE